MSSRKSLKDARHYEYASRPGYGLTGTAVTKLLSAVLVLGVLAGFLLAGGSRMVAQQVDPEQRALYLAREQALQPWRIAGGAAVRAAGIAVLMTGAGCLVGAAVAALHWLNLRARLVRPTEAGLFPIVDLGQGALYDPNRDNAGAHPVIAAAALDVQRTAALTHGGNVQIHWHERASSPATVPAETPATLRAVLPERLPLRALMHEPVTLARLVLGVAVDDQSGQLSPVTGDMSDLVHIAVGGSSGWGKSVFLRSLAYQMVVAQESPDLVAIDLEGVTLSPLANSPRLLFPLADNEPDARAVLEGVREELERRKRLYAEFPGVDSLATYNARTRDPLRPLIILCDEATALLGDSDVEDALRSVTLRARKYGVWAVLAGQDWKASSLDTAIRNQLSTRVQFKAMSAAQSRVLLGKSGAEEISVQGRALAVLPGRDLIEIQAPLVTADMLAQAARSQGEGPQRELPREESAENRPAMVVDDADLENGPRVLMLHRQGLSMRQIELRIFGYTGGSANAFVKRVIDGSSSSDGGEDLTPGERG